MESRTYVLLLLLVYFRTMAYRYRRGRARAYRRSGGYKRYGRRVNRMVSRYGRVRRSGVRRASSRRIRNF